MPRKTYDTRWAKLTWSPEHDVLNEFLPISTSTSSTSPPGIVTWIHKHSEAIHAVRQRHPGGKWHWHVSFRMPRTFSSLYFYSKKSANAWWVKELKELGYEEPAVMVTPMEDGRAIGYEHHDEFEVMYSDFDQSVIDNAVAWCKLLDNKKRRRTYLDKITTLPRAKISHAIATAKEDYNVQCDSEAIEKLIDEGWAFEGDEQFESVKRRRYNNHKTAL